MGLAQDLLDARLALDRAKGLQPSNQTSPLPDLRTLQRSPSAPTSAESELMKARQAYSEQLANRIRQDADNSPSLLEQAKKNTQSRPFAEPTEPPPFKAQPSTPNSPPATTPTSTSPSTAPKIPNVPPSLLNSLKGGLPSLLGAFLQPYVDKAGDDVGNRAADYLYNPTGRRKAKEALDAANRRYDEALKNKSKSPPPPSNLLNDAARLSNGGVYDVSIAGVVDPAYGTGLTPQPATVRVTAPYAIAESADWWGLVGTGQTVPTTSYRKPFYNGAVITGAVLVEAGTPASTPTPDNPYPQSPSPVPNNGSLPWLPPVDLRGSPTDRKLFPSGELSSSKTPSPSPTPNAQPAPKPVGNPSAPANNPSPQTGGANPTTAPTPTPNQSPTGATPRSSSPSPNAQPVNSPTPTQAPTQTPTPTPPKSNNDTFTILAAIAALAGSLAGGISLVNYIKGLNEQINQQTSPTAQKANVAEGMCNATQPGNCARTNIENAVTNATNPIKDIANSNSGLLAGINTALSGFIAFSQTAFGKILSFLDNTIVDRAIGVANFAMNAHNALMLSNALGKTLAGIVDTALGATGFQFTNTEGQKTTASRAFTSNVSALIVNLIGQDLYTELTDDWKVANRIYQSGTNLLNKTERLLSGQSKIAQKSGIDVANIGNALRANGIVNANSYPPMAATKEANTPTELLLDVNTPLASIQSGIKNLNTVTKNVSGTIKQVTAIQKEFGKLQDLTNKESKVRKSLRTQSARQAKIKAKFTLLQIKQIKAKGQKNANS